jgi:hypothetical protein
VCSLKKHEIDGTYYIQGGMKKAYNFSVGKSELNEQIGDLGIVERIILK